MKIYSLFFYVGAAVLLSACDKTTTSETAATPATVVQAVPAPSEMENTLGKSVFNKTCALCHAAGIAGAPKPGDKDDWKTRIEQGKDILYRHAIEGYTGEKGVMPARGGVAKLSDEDVKAAVDYMVSKSN